MANELNPEVLRRFAKLGAQARLEQIEMERKAILSTFPDLVQRRGRPQRGTHPSPQAAKPTAVRRRRMTAAQRKEVSDRMKKYWAERKKKGGKE